MSSSLSCAKLPTRHVNSQPTAGCGRVRGMEWMHARDRGRIDGRSQAAPVREHAHHSLRTILLRTERRISPERAGLAVELITSPDPSRTGHMLLEHAADVSWGAPMRVLQHHQADAACELTCFAQVVARDPFILPHGHRPNPTFRFQDLPRYRVAACEVPTPWLTLQDDLLAQACRHQTYDTAGPTNGRNCRSIPPRRGRRHPGAGTMGRSPGPVRCRACLAPVSAAR